MTQSSIEILKGISESTSVISLDWNDSPLYPMNFPLPCRYRAPLFIQLINGAPYPSNENWAPINWSNYSPGINLFSNLLLFLQRKNGTPTESREGGFPGTTAVSSYPLRFLIYYKSPHCAKQRQPLKIKSALKKKMYSNWI